MSRKSLLVIVILMSCMALFAEEKKPGIFMQHMTACFNVDLSADTYVRHSDSPQWENNPSKNTSKYNDKQIAAVIGVQNSSAETTITLTFTGNNWYYLLNGSDTRYKRPFGLDMITRVPEKSESKKHLTQGVTHMGRQASNNGDLSNSATMTLPKTDGSEKNSKGNPIYEAWLDVVLVLDPAVNPATGLVRKLENNKEDITDENDRFYGYLVSSNDVYTTSFRIDVRSGDLTESYFFMMNGYYVTEIKPFQQFGEYYLNFSVHSNANAISFDAKELKGSIAIGDYSLVTNSVRSDKNGYNPEATAYVFPSSSPLGSVDGGKFTLRYVSPASNTTIVETNDYNSVEYKVGLKQQGAKEPKWFDGTDTFDSITDKINKSKEDGSDPGGVKAKTIVEYSANTQTNNVRVTDTGDIMLEITGDTADLMAGRYRSDIYLHVVTDW